MNKSVDFAELKSRAIAAIKVSGESSYARRAPNKRSIPLLETLAREFDVGVQTNPASVEQWELKSIIEETLLRYDDAIASHLKADALRGAPSQKSKKRLARLLEQKRDWATAPLDAKDTASLGKYLARRVTFSSAAAKDPLAHTKAWLSEHQDATTSAKTIKSFRQRGYFSDFSILYNFVKG